MHLDHLIQPIKAPAKGRGSLCPSTPEEALRYVIGEIDLILLMTVNPGFGGQKFLSSQRPKIRRIREMIGACQTYVELDGGVKAKNARDCADAGADVLAAGCTIFKGGWEIYADNIEALRGFSARGAVP